MKHLVILGAGPVHLRLLADLCSRLPLGLRITLLTPAPRQLNPRLLPALLARRYRADACTFALPAQLEKSAIHRLAHNAVRLDAAAQVLTLDAGSSLDFDLLSINLEPVQDRLQIEQAIPGAREHALFLRPLDTFVALWPKLLEFAATRTPRVAVIGADMLAFELAMTLAHELRGASVTLLTGATPSADDYSPRVKNECLNALKARQITHIAQQAVGICASEVHLSSGARLVCDVPIIALRAGAPNWLADSALARDTQGLIMVDRWQRSTSHPQVLVAGELAARADLTPPHRARVACSSNAAYTSNLRALLAGRAPTRCETPLSPLNLLSLGGSQALASWGDWCLQGRLAGALKNWLDRPPA